MIGKPGRRAVRGTSSMALSPAARANAPTRGTPDDHRERRHEHQPHDGGAAFEEVTARHPDAVARDPTRTRGSSTRYDTSTITLITTNTVAM